MPLETYPCTKARVDTKVLIDSPIGTIYCAGTDVDVDNSRAMIICRQCRQQGLPIKLNFAPRLFGLLPPAVTPARRS